MNSSVSRARLNANRANAQLSTGPKTAEGKQTSSRNALKTALTGRTVLLPGDDAERYEKHLEHYRKLWQPVGEHEHLLVQALADSWWRLERIPGLEAALYAKGRAELADKVSDPALLQLETYLAYEKHFRNLNLQERRLSGHAAQLKAELQEAQSRRRKRDGEALARAARLYTAAKKQGKPFNPSEHGFEFSTAELEHYLKHTMAGLMNGPNRPLCF